MSSQLNRPLSPIYVLSRLSSSPGVIDISSDSSPALGSHALLYSQAGHRSSVALDYHVATDQSVLISHTPTVVPAHSSHTPAMLSAFASRSSISDISYPAEFELAQMRKHCLELESQVNRLTGQLGTLQ